MSEKSRPKIEELVDELELWKKLVHRYQAKGIDLAQLMEEWAKDLENGLTSPGARDDFTELCKAGCLAKGLAVLVFARRHVTPLERVWTETVGQPNSRARTAASLESAAETLKKLYGGVMASEFTSGTEHFAKLGRIPIPRLSSELRFHVKVINFFAMLSVDTEARSLDQVARYLVSSYVKQMTGDVVLPSKTGQPT